MRLRSRCTMCFRCSRRNGFFAQSPRETTRTAATRSSTTCSQSPYSRGVATSSRAQRLLRQRGEPTMSPRCRSKRCARLAVATPREYGLCEHVVEDLVAAVLVVSLGDCAKNPLRREHLKHIVQRDRSLIRVTDEVTEGLRDFRSRGRHEELQRARRDLRIAWRQCAERALEMCADDGLGAAEAA